MKRPIDKQFLDSLAIPNPCSVAWDSMNGDDRVRSCTSCERPVYNLADVPDSEMLRLLSEGGRVCVAASRAPNGRLIEIGHLTTTASSVRKFARLPAAALAALLGVSHPVAASTGESFSPSASSGQQTVSQPGQRAPRNPGTVRGTIYDINGAIIVAAEITATDETTNQKFTATSGADGTYELSLPPGTYEVWVKASYFRPYSVTDVRVRSGNELKLDATLDVGVVGEIVSVPHQKSESPLSKVFTAPFKALKRVFGSH